MRPSVRGRRRCASRLLREAFPLALLALALPGLFAWSPLASRLSLAVSAVLLVISAVVTRDIVRRPGRAVVTEPPVRVRERRAQARRTAA